MDSTAVHIKKAILYGICASAILLGLYFLILSLVSGWAFAQDQFSAFWYFIVSLAVGFGIQVGLYIYLRGIMQGTHNGGKVLGVTSATSTAAMISCCSHYLVNLIPILGITGLVTFVAAYQVQLFWIGILFNIFGIIYIASKIRTVILKTV